MCGKCKKAQQPATSYCRDCGEFICAMCTTIHSNWDDFAGHEVVALEQLESKMKELDVLKKVTFYCSLHKGKELEIYCETCEKLICHNCTVTKHCRPEHKYSLVDVTFEQHKAKIITSLEPIEKQVGIVNKALEELNRQSAKIDDQCGTTNIEIEQLFRQIYDVLEARKADLVNQVYQFANQKLKNLAAQKDEVETVQTQLASCLSFVRESLRTGSQGEVMKMKKTVMKQIKEMTDNFKSDTLPPCESTNVKFIASSELIQICKQFGEVYTSHVSPERYKHCISIFSPTGEKLQSLGSQGSGPGQFDQPRGVTMVNNDNILVTDCNHCIQMFTSECNTRVGSHGSNHSQFNHPFSVAVSPLNMEIVVSDCFNDRIQILNSNLTFNGSIGRRGSGNGQFGRPFDIAFDSAGNIYVTDASNARIQVFNPEGKFLRQFGKRGKGDGKLNYPNGICIDSDDRVYVTECSNHRVSVFTCEGQFLTSFGSYGNGPGQFKSSRAITVDKNGIIYVSDSGNNRIQIF